MPMHYMTGEQIRKAIEVTKKSLDSSELGKEVGLKIAAAHNERRKSEMIEAMKQLYAYLHGTGNYPMMDAAKVFDPEEGAEKTNVYYMFKELKKGMPWEIRRDYLITPIALTLVMFDLASALFPCSQVYKAKLTFEGLVNLITLPVYRPEISEEEAREKREDYMRKLKNYEDKMLDLYRDLSIYFGELLEPKRNPITNAIHETNERTKKVAKKLKVMDTPPNLTAQIRAAKIWQDHCEDVTLAVKGRKIGYADVFEFCKRDLLKLGIKSPEEFKKAVRSSQRRTLRVSK